MKIPRELSLDELRVVRANNGRYVAQLTRDGVECAGPGGVEKNRVDHDLIEQASVDPGGRGVLP